MNIRVSSSPTREFDVAYVDRDLWNSDASRYSIYDLLVEKLCGIKSGMSGFVTYTPCEWEGVVFPKPTIFVPDLLPEEKEKRLSRLYFGGVLHHEFAHLNGAGELEAYNAQAAYLRQNGLNGPSDKQIFLDLEGYSKQDQIEAEIKAFGSYHGALFSFCRALWVIVTEGYYSVKKDPGESRACST